MLGRDYAGLIVTWLRQAAHPVLTPLPLERGERPAEHAANLLRGRCRAPRPRGRRQPRRPRVGQVLFLTVVAFLLTNKVYSPQYALWLLPLVALARPRWREVLIWQASEIVVLIAKYLHLAYLSTNTASGIPEGWVAGTVLVRDAVLVWLCWLVVRDVLRPQHDPVRAGTGVDDPAGGVLEHAPDVGWLRAPPLVRPAPTGVG